MRTLKFKNSLAEKILGGAKTSTWQMFDDKDLGTGDIIHLVNADSGTVFSIAKVTDILKKRLGDITADDFTGHENYKSIDEMYSVYRGYYGDRVDGNTEIKIVHFELVSNK